MQPRASGLPAQPPILAAGKAFAFALAGALLALQAVRLVSIAATPAGPPFLAAGLLAGYLAADLMSGTIHWFCDTFFDEGTPVIGRRVIWPFRDHHRNPLSITAYRLLEQDGTSYVIVIPPLIAALWSSMPDSSDPLGLFVHAAVCGFAAGSMGTNLFHKWAHTPEPPRLVRWLQRRRLILSPHAHAVHHRAYVGGYCVTSGWMNPLLDRIDFFGRLERCVRVLIGKPAL